jgi:hypothetical protein
MGQISVPSQSALQIGVFRPIPGLARKTFAMVSSAVYFALGKYALPVARFFQVHIHFCSPLHTLLDK